MRLEQRIKLNVSSAMNLDTFLQIAQRVPTLPMKTNRNVSIVVAMATCQGIAQVETAIPVEEGDLVDEDAVVVDVEDVEDTK